MGNGGIELTDDLIIRLLSDLCRIYGFCLPPTENQRIAALSGLTPESLADEVLKAEGFVPEYEKQWRKELTKHIRGCLDRWVQP